MSKLMKLLAAGGMMAGLLAFAPTAEAHPGTAVECEVSGSVTTNFQTYEFVSATLVCEGSIDGVPAFGAYDVDATGNTKGLIDPTAGETCGDGQSDGPGVLTATLDSSLPNLNAPQSFAGSVEFSRVELAVAASGTLADENGHEVDFVAPLAFIPTTPLALADCVDGTPARLDAALAGTATLTDHS